MPDAIYQAVIGYLTKALTQVRPSPSIPRHYLFAQHQAVPVADLVVGLQHCLDAQRRADQAAIDRANQRQQRAHGVDVVVPAASVGQRDRRGCGQAA